MSLNPTIGLILGFKLELPFNVLNPSPNRPS
jgi:hypothetical protein